MRLGRFYFLLVAILCPTLFADTRTIGRPSCACLLMTCIKLRNSGTTKPHRGVSADEQLVVLLRGGNF
jgi:hypothetical protein